MAANRRPPRDFGGMRLMYGAPPPQPGQASPWPPFNRAEPPDPDLPSNYETEPNPAPQEGPSVASVVVAIQFLHSIGLTLGPRDWRVQRLAYLLDGGR